MIESNGYIFSKEKHKTKWFKTLNNYLTTLNNRKFYLVKQHISHAKAP